MLQCYVQVNWQSWIFIVLYVVVHRCYNNSPSFTSQDCWWTAQKFSLSPTIWQFKLWSLEICWLSFDSELCVVKGPLYDNSGNWPLDEVQWQRVKWQRVLVTEVTGSVYIKWQGLKLLRDVLNCDVQKFATSSSETMSVKQSRIILWAGVFYIIMLYYT